MDLEVAPVDPVVVGDDHLGQLDVAVLDRLEGAVERLDDEIEAPECPILELVELVLVVAPGRSGISRPSR